MGYYPTPPQVIQDIATYFFPSDDDERGRLLDPCAGKGAAAALLGRLLDCQTWGAELSPVRAEEAAKVMDRLLPVAWETASLTNESISVLFLNPPYDWDRRTSDDEKAQRLEYKFLHSCTPKLVRGQGILVYVVPQHLLERDKVARYLAGHYEDTQAVRFPDGEYERFKQIVVLGRRRVAYKTPTGNEIEAIQRLAQTDLPPLKAVETPCYSVIPALTRGANGRPVRYYRAAWSPEDMVAATRQIGVHTTQEWADLHANGNGMVDIRPAMPLKKGHVAMLMSSGMMGTLRLSDADERPMLVKGRVVKVPHKIVEEVQTNKRGEKEEVVKWRDRFITTVAALSKAGLSVIKDVVDLTAFMKAHGDKIANHILQAYRPLYNLTPTLAEQAVVDRLGTERKPLPGQAKAGLLPTQMHAAIAMARAIKEHGTGNLQGEMGLGKTTIGAAVTDLLDAYPAIIICPPHLVPKWIREVQEVVPGAYARELRRIGRNSEDPGDVNDVRIFLDDHASGKISRKAVAVVASTSAKMGPGWKAAAPVARVVPQDPEKLARFKQALKAAKRARQAYLAARRTSGANAVEHLETLRQEAARARREALQLATPRKATAAHVCPTCGQVQTKVVSGVEQAITGSRFEKKRRFCMAQVPGWELEQDGRLKRDDAGNTVWGFRECGAPLYENTGTRRYSIAQYIKEQAHGRFKLLIADEVHQYKAKSSDRGVAFHHLAAATAGTLTLTGTFFGGKSTSIFWLLHRLSGGVRQDFHFNDEKRWASLYGIMETTERRKYGEDGDDGVFTGNRRYQNRAKEVPGVSPAIISRLLNTTLFLNLKDLGVALPAYAEEVVVLDMDEGQEDQYGRMSRSLRKMALESMRYMSAWLQWSLSRPNSGFRDEVVKLPFVVGKDEEGQEITQKQPFMNLPAVTATDPKSPDRWLPKERWLADYCRAERTQGRKVLVYVRQTGTRDIQDRVKASLEAAGLRVAVLGGNVSPRRREKWVDQKAPHIDVLITNPRLVETGLDLVQFATVVFYEIEYSLYTLWQACRRVWRLGQTKPVKVVFAVYAGSMESKALALMGRKMKAAQLLYGDEVGGAIVPEDGGDFLTELAREVLEGKELPDLQTLFADNGKVTVEHEPLVVETAVESELAPSRNGKSVRQLTMLDLFQRHGAQTKKPGSRNKGRSAVVQQLSLFGDSASQPALSQ
jgi:hypothetical protein